MYEIRRYSILRTPGPICSSMVFKYGIDVQSFRAETTNFTQLKTFRWPRGMSLGLGTDHLELRFIIFMHFQSGFFSLRLQFKTP